MRAWSSALRDERARLKKIKSLAVSMIKRSPELAKIWSELDNVAYGNAQLNERDLALQAFAVAMSRHHGQSTSDSTPKSKGKPSAQPSSSSEPMDVHADEEMHFLRDAAQTLKDTRTLTRQIKRLAKATGVPHPKEVRAARQIFQKVSAEVDDQGALCMGLKMCVERGHADRSSDCVKALTFMNDVRMVLKQIDPALDRMERKR